MKTGKHRFSRKLFGLLATGMLLGASPLVWSNGSQLLVQDVSHLGLAYAGTAATANDAGTNFYNPAGLTRLPCQQLVLGGVYVLPRLHIDVTQATATNGALVPGMPSRAKTESAGGLIPNLHYSHRLWDNWAFGISILSNFGSKTDFADNSFVRYIGTTSELITTSLVPSLAYNFCNGLSLGLGADIMYGFAKLDARTSPIPFVIPNPATDGFVKQRAHGEAYGFHVGALYEFNDCTRVGLAYHSRLNLKLRGHQLAQLAPGLVATDVGARTTLHLPDTATLSGYHAIDHCWAVMADVSWYHWSVYKNIRINYKNGTAVNLPQNWHDSYRIALGTTYQYDCDWQFKLGASVDRTPTRDSTRPIYLPDADYYGLGVGAQYKLAKCLAVDLGYSHIFYRPVRLNIAPPTSIGFPQGLQTLQGRSLQQVDVFGLQLTWDIA